MTTAVLERGGEDLIGVPADVRVEGVLGRGAFGSVYLAERDGRPVALKLQRLDGRDPRTFWREASSLARMHHPGLPGVLDAGVLDGRAYLVMELIEGDLLADRLAEGALEPESVERLAVELADILHTVHGAGLVHRDVSPRNIVVGPGGEAHLIDFGTVTRDVIDGVAGTPHYAPPEQTGMVSRPLDARSDLYAFGAVLFEAATGRPPYEHHDPLEIMRKHAVEPLPDLASRAPGLPDGLVALIRSLLAKDMDDRPSSAAAVLQALGRAPTDGGRAALRGRERELAVLEEAWSRAEAGRGGVLLVRGPSGMGKSRLARELPHASRSGGVWCAKCEPDEPLPMAPLLRSLQRWLADDPSASEVIREVVGVDSRLLLYLGAPLDGCLDGTAVQVSQDQVLGAAVRMIERLSLLRGPLLWVIDDIQWLDPEMRVLLLHLAVRLPSLPLLVVATARSEPAWREPVQAFQRETGQALLETIELGPLDEQGVGDLLAAELGRVAPEIVAHVWRRSGGHPLMALELMRAMLDAGVLLPGARTWSLDATALHHLELPTTVAELVLSRLRGLDEATRALLAAMAIGVANVTLERLVVVLDQPASDVARALERAVGEGVVEPASAASYVFLHDRLREALLADLTAAAQQDLHRRWTDALLAEGSSEVYALAHHAWEGGLPGRQALVHRLCREAAGSAFDQSAFERAMALYQRAEQAAEAGGVELDGDFCLRFGDACARAGRMELGHTWMQRGLALTRDPVARAELFSLLGSLSMGRLDNDTARGQIAQGMREIGVPLIDQGAASLLRSLWAFVLGWIAHRVPRVLPRRMGRRERLELELTVQIGVASYFQMDALSLVQSVVRARPLAQRMGRGEDYALWAVRSSTIAASTGRHQLSRDLFREALEIAEARRDPVLIGFVRAYGSFAVHFRGECLEAARMARETLENWGPTMENFQYLTVTADLTWNLLMRGHVVEAARWLEEGRERVALSPTDLTEGHTYRTYAGPIYAMLGRSAEGAGHLEAFREVAARLPPDRWRESQLLAHTLLFLVLEERTGAEFQQVCERFDAMGLRPGRTPLQVKQGWIARAYWRLSGVEAGRGDVDALGAALRALRGAANHPTVLAHLRVVEAGLFAHHGQSSRAARALDEAESIAARTDNPWIDYEVALRRARLLDAQDLVGAARRQREHALQIARSQRWGRRIQTVKSQLSGSNLATLASTGDALARRDLEALLEVGRASVSGGDRDERTQRVLEEVLRVASAERAVLFFPSEGEMSFFAGRQVPGEPLTEAEDVSRSVLRTVFDSQEALVFTGTADGELSSSGSMLAHDLRSVAAAPLALSDRVLGVLYVDTTLARGAFTKRTAHLLSAIATQLAFGVETTRLAGLEAAMRGERLANQQLEQRVRERTEALARSLTHLEREVEERRAAERAAQVASRAKSVFLATMSHELRTPLNAILGYSELLADELEAAGQDDLLPDLERIGAAGLNLLEIIDGVLDLARIEADELQVRQESVELGPLLQGVTEGFAERASLRGNTLIWSVAPGAESCCADPERLRSALGKVVDNAVQFTQGGTIELRAVPSREGVEIEVRDSGIGIPTAFHERVFERFTQVDGSSTRTHGGAGLGLAIARDLVGRMGGTLRLESEEGVGSRFFLWLPVRSPGCEACRSPASA